MFSSLRLSDVYLYVFDDGKHSDYVDGDDGDQMAVPGRCWGVAQRDHEFLCLLFLLHIDQVLT